MLTQKSTSWTKTTPDDTGKQQQKMYFQYSQHLASPTKNLHIFREFTVHYSLIAHTESSAPPSSKNRTPQIFAPRSTGSSRWTGSPEWNSFRLPVVPKIGSACIMQIFAAPTNVRLNELGRGRSWSPPWPSSTTITAAPGWPWDPAARPLLQIEPNQPECCID